MKSRINNTDNKVMNYFIYYCINFFYNERGYLKKRLLSPRNFTTDALAANDFNLNSAGYVNNNSVWNGNGVRASFLLRLVDTNVLRANGYDY